MEEINEYLMKWHEGWYFNQVWWILKVKNNSFEALICTWGAVNELEVEINHPHSRLLTGYFSPKFHLKPFVWRRSTFPKGIIPHPVVSLHFGTVIEYYSSGFIRIITLYCPIRMMSIFGWQWNQLVATLREANVWSIRPPKAPNAITSW